MTWSLLQTLKHNLMYDWTGRDVDTVPEDASAEKALEVLKSNKRKSLPVVDANGNLVRIIGTRPGTQFPSSPIFKAISSDSSHHGRPYGHGMKIKQRALLSASMS